MAYADQQMSSSKLIALIVVAVLHVVLGYGLISGLAQEGMRKVLKRVTTIDIEEEVVKEEESPPEPPKIETPPPPVAPPVEINIAPAPPKIVTVQTPPPPAPIVVAQPVPPPPKPATPRNRPGTWATSNDYPTHAFRRKLSGTTTFRVTINEKGRVATCTIVRSSGHADLDAATCKNVKRRARFRKPSKGYGTTYTNRVRWVIPD